MKTHDVFISHASEDKTAVALPLADHLTRAGLKVWLDALELRIGDSLRERIDQGLSHSQFGIVILSPSFFQKEWPKREVNAMFALEEDGARVLLPVWHQVTKEDVRAFSPMLADRFAASTEQGIDAVARAIANVVQKDGVTAALSRLIEQGPSSEDLAAFLAMRPQIVRRATFRYGLFGTLPDVVQNPDLPPFHLMSRAVQGSDGSYTNWYLAFQPSAPTSQDDQRLVLFLATCAEVMEQVFQASWAARLADRSTPRVLSQATVYYGRRERLSEQAREIMRLHNEQLHIRVHSYDQLLEASASLE